MAIVRDLSGNNFGLDPRKAGKYDLPILQWKGAQQQVAIGAGSLQSAKFANTARALRIAPDQDIHYRVRANPTALATDAFLAAGAVEDIQIKSGERIAIIQDSTAGFVTLTEDG